MSTCSKELEPVDTCPSGLSVFLPGHLLRTGCMSSPPAWGLQERPCSQETALLSLPLGLKSCFWKKIWTRVKTLNCKRDGQLGRWAEFQSRRQALPCSAGDRLGRDRWPTAPWRGGTQEAKFTIHAPLLTEKP